MSTPVAILLIIAGLWNVAIWPRFWMRINADPRSRDADGRVTPFFTVHLVLIAVSMTLGLAVGIVGLAGLF